MISRFPFGHRANILTGICLFAVYEVKKVLEKQIRELIEKGEEVKFYKSKAWQMLRVWILEKYHYECQECLKKGKYTRAKVVHHVNELKKRPDLALSEYYVDIITGERKPNLIPLCQDCHNIVHERICEAEYKPQLNEERW